MANKIEVETQEKIDALEAKFEALEIALGSFFPSFFQNSYLKDKYEKTDFGLKKADTANAETKPE